MAQRKVIKFLNNDLSVNESDYKDPLFLFFIADIEFKELMHGQGIAWLDHLQNNYKFVLHDISVTRQIREIMGDKRK